MPKKFDDSSSMSASEVRRLPPDEQAKVMKHLQGVIDRLLARAREREETINKAIQRVIPDYDGSNRSLCKLAGILSKHYPREPLSDWHELPVDELLGYIDSIAEQPAVTTDKAVATSSAKSGKKRGGQSKADEDIKIAEEYARGLEAREWDSKADFARKRHPSKTESAIRYAIIRGEGALRELNQKSAKRSH